MAKRKPQLYVHKNSGDITYATSRQAKELGEDWSKVDFVDNEEGKPVMRLHLEGATVDISENLEAALDGNPETD